MFDKIKSELDKLNVALVAVSKTKSVEEIMQIYQKGQRTFGENRVQEMVDKYHQMPKNIQWHMIGHLQKNKVKYIAEFVSLIHSVDNEKLLSTISKEGEKHNRVIDYLLQLKIAEEDSKYGLTMEESQHLIEKISNHSFPNTRCRGLMGMATFTDDNTQIRKEFSLLKNHFELLKSNNIKSDAFDILSMGMSGDYKIALEEGSNMVRIGSLIFGPRN